MNRPRRSALRVPSAHTAVLVATLLAVGAADLAGQTGAIHGRVVRADQPVGLADAELVLSPSGDTTRTDEHGYFAFPAVASGQVEVTARLPGFVSARVAVRVTGRAVTELEIPLEPVAYVLDPIVTSVTGEPRSLGEVAGAVSVADSSAILRDRTVGLHEALRMMPGVQVTSRYGTHDVNIGIRGSASQTFQAVRGVAVLLDGVPLTQPEGRTRVDIIELAAARQVEVARGPGSTLHSASTGGVVNLVSRTGRDSRGTHVRAQGGGFGFHKVDGRAGGVFAGERASGLVGASYTSTDGYRALSGAEVLRGHMVLDYLVSEDTRVFFQAVGSRLDSRLPGSLSQPQFDTDPYMAAPAAEAFGFQRNDRSYRASARVETTAGSTAAGGYLSYGRGTLLLTIPSLVVDNDLRRIQGGGRLRAGGVADLPLDVTAGFDYDRLLGPGHQWENDAGVPGGLLVDEHYDVPWLGAYAQAEWRAASTVTATLGLRHDRVAYRIERSIPGPYVPRTAMTIEQTSPTLAVRWRPAAATSVYASVGRGFEIPTLPEVSAFAGDPIRPVRPKSLWNYEVGGRRTIGNRVLVEGAAFLAAVRGEFIPVSVDGRDLSENASRSRNAGVELGVTALATRWLDVGTSYTFLDLRLREYTTSVLDSGGAFREVDFSGKRMPAVPRQRLTAEAQLRPLNRLDLGVQVEWQGVVHVETGNADRGIWYFQPQPDGPVQEVPFRSVPARALLHLNAAYRLGPATVFGRVENLFGQRYAGNVRANEIFGRFYEAGSPAWASLGLSLSGWSPAPDAGR